MQLDSGFAEGGCVLAGVMRAEEQALAGREDGADIGTSSAPIATISSGQRLGRECLCHLHIPLIGAISSSGSSPLSDPTITPCGILRAEVRVRGKRTLGPPPRLASGCRLVPTGVAPGSVGIIFRRRPPPDRPSGAPRMSPSTGFLPIDGGSAWPTLIDSRPSIALPRGHPRGRHGCRRGTVASSSTRDAA